MAPVRDHIFTLEPSPDRIIVKGMEIPLSARSVSRTLVSILLVLLGCHLLVATGHFLLHRPLAPLTILFDLDLEANVPVVFNSALFFLAALLFHLAGRTEPKGRRLHWTGLTLAFIFLGIDEVSELHERLISIGRSLLGQGGDQEMGLLYFAWVIPYGLAVLAMMALYARFLLRLPGRTRYGLILSGAVYLAGAVVLEMYSGKVAETLLFVPLPDGTLDGLPCAGYPPSSCVLYQSAPYVFFYTMEETLEMLGLILCIHAMMLHLGRGGLRLDLRFLNPESRAGG